MNTGKLPQRPKTYSGHVWQQFPYGIHETKDGYLALSTNVSDSPEAYEKALGIEGMAEKIPDIETAFNDRDELYALLAPELKKQTTEYWLERFRRYGIWCAKVNDYADVETDPQVVYNNIIQEIEHPKAGKIKVIGCPIDFSGTPSSIRLPPPLLGQHNEEILSELGYSQEEIEQLRANGVPLIISDISSLQNKNVSCCKSVRSSAVPQSYSG
ncbi:MAG: CoA transferase [bacterium]|nr:CoA transferase [bacterium]